MSSWLIIIIALIVFSLLITALYTNCPVPTEGWVDYQDIPYGNIHTGAGDVTRPAVFYNYPVYRRPLNWPVCHLVNYPVPHCRSDSL
jgi:hypothetical protein